MKPCPFCGGPSNVQATRILHSVDCFFSIYERFTAGDLTQAQAVLRAWNVRATIPDGDAKASTCCPGEHLVPMHSTDTKMCTGCKTERLWPLEPGQKRTFE